MKSHHDAIRKLIKENQDGLSADQIAANLKILPRTTRKSLSFMPDAYIDRWEGPTQGQYTAIWCVVDVPENCPHPKKDNHVFQTSSQE